VIINAGHPSRSMGTDIKQVASLIVTILIFSTSLSQAAEYAVVGGGDPSSGVISNSVVNIGMPSFDQFVRDYLPDHQTTFRVLSHTGMTSPNTNATINQTDMVNASRNSTIILRMIGNIGNITPDNRTVKLGASGINDKTVSTLALASFNNDMI